MAIFCSSLAWCGLGKITREKTGCCRDKGRFRVCQELQRNSAARNNIWDAQIQHPQHMLASAVHFSDVSVLYRPQWKKRVSSIVAVLPPTF